MVTLETDDSPVASLLLISPSFIASPLASSNAIPLSTMFSASTIEPSDCKHNGLY